MSTLPEYVEYGGRATAAPPFLSKGGVFHGYLLKGDAGLIADLCERMFDRPAAGKVEYRPLFGDRVLMLTGSFARVSSQAANFSNWGYLDEAQISLWVPVGAGHSEDGRFVMDRMCMAVPYIVVNNPMSYAGGREDYGYPKSLGRFEPAGGIGDPLRVEAFGGNFAPENQAGWHVLFELARGAQIDDPPEAPRHRLHDFFRSSALEPSELSVIEEIIEALAHKEIRQVFLKQFRDVSTAGLACYQTVVEAPIHFLSAKAKPSLHEWSITIDPLDSHPIGKELGVFSQTTRLSFEVHMDMVAEVGLVVAP